MVRDGLGTENKNDNEWWVGFTNTQGSLVNYVVYN